MPYAFACACATDNFLTGTLPTGLSQLHLLRDLQLGHNQFAMQDRDQLAGLLGGMVHLKTLDIAMSDEVPVLEKTLIQPTPPLMCRVLEDCSITLVTRTIESVQLPHGGVAMTVQADHSDETTECKDNMDGSYKCAFPESWRSRQGDFEFTLFADHEEFTPLRALIDPTTGDESTENAYKRLGCLVAPMLCQQPHSFVDDDGAACLCEAGFYKRTYAGGWDCASCGRGEEPIDDGTRCQECPFGTYSSSGQACISCAPGEKPNMATGANDCVGCNSLSISPSGVECTRCADGFEADENGTACICPRGTYNSTGFSHSHAVQCLGDLHSEPTEMDAPPLCVSCSDLPCIDCNAEIPTLRQGWATAGTDEVPSKSPWLIFECPIQHACVNQQQQRCHKGHAGILCNVCEAGYVLEDNECQLCRDVSSSPALQLLLLGLLALGVGVAYSKRARAEANRSASSLDAQLTTTDNPLQFGSFDAVDQRQSLGMRTVQRTDDAYMLVRVLYQPTRILVGYVQVVSQIGLVLDIPYPHFIQVVFESLKPFAGLLTELFHLKCLGNLSFYQQWIGRVFIMPLLLGSFAVLRYVYAQRQGDETAAKNAAGSLKSDAFFILFVIYRACMHAVLPVSYTYARLHCSC